MRCRQHNIHHHEMKLSLVSITATLWIVASGHDFNGDFGEHKRHYLVLHYLIFPPINFLYSHMITDIPVLWLVSFFVRTDREQICSVLVSYEAGSLVCTQTARPCCEIGKIISTQLTCSLLIITVQSNELVLVVPQILLNINFE